MYCINIDVCKTSKIYKTAGKCDDDQQHESILDSEMVSTPEGCNDNSPMKTHKFESTKKNSARKSLHQFQRHRMSKIILPFVGYVQLTKSARKLEQAMHCGQTLQSAMVIQKPTKRSDNKFTIVL